MNQPVSCGILIVRGRPIDSFLLMKHPDRWDIPKGHVDPGETELECAFREMEEETGIPADAITLLPEYRYEAEYMVSAKRYGGKRDEQVKKKLVLFLGRLDKEHKVIVTEHGDFEWFDWSPPHQVQKRTIDPMLSLLEEYVKQFPEN